MRPFLRVVPVDDAELADDERVVREFESIYGPLSEHDEIESKQDVVDAIARANVIDVASSPRQSRLPSLPTNRVDR